LKSGDIDGGKTWKYTFSEAGSYAFVCTYHPWMKGTIAAVPADR
jgi:plastocyanin